MAPRTKPQPQTTQSTALTNYDDELARQAAEYAKQEESAGGAQFFSVRGGALTFAGAQMPGNQVAVIIADAIMENVFYEGDYDPDAPQPPMCYSFGRDERDMEPHANVRAASNHQHDTCSGCPHNEWGSADKGRGKACKNSRRLVLLPAGSLDDRGRLTLPDDPEEYLASAGFGFFRLPVTSVKGYANFVKQVAGALKLPPHGVIVRMRVAPDPSTQFKVIFEPLQPVPKDLLAVVMRRHSEARALIENPYPVPEEAPKPKKVGSRATATKRGR